MPSPFPGMDPYLEHPARWPSVHAAMIAQIGRQLNKALRPKYAARIEKRVYIADESDVEGSISEPDILIQKHRSSGVMAVPATVTEPVTVMMDLEFELEEWSLKITRFRSQEIVCIIELVSPSNKRPGSDSRRQYLKKQRETIGSDTHWVEIDLIRSGRSTIPSIQRGRSEYAAFVSNASKRPHGTLWPISLTAPLPIIGIPIAKGDADASLDLQMAFNEIYDENYDIEIDYSVPPVPPLTAKQAKWASKLLKNRK